ncbi:MAG TPA: methionine adenosyltransferase [Burkholderiales bacterium]|nr:methionine adenosyltransferase [Burkholderiales bacterium]
MKQNFMFTSESVTEGHPDKLCDLISDAIVDRFLLLDPFTNIVAECAVSTGILFVAARFDNGINVDIPNLARQVIQEIGYDESTFDAKTCSVMTSLQRSPRNTYVNKDESDMDDEEIERTPARNQVTLFGFACKQTPALMPLPIWLAHKLARRLTTARLEQQLPYLGADGSTQIGVEYRNRRPHRIHSITLVASERVDESRDLKTLRDDLMQTVIEPAFIDEPVKPDRDTRIFINPEGPFIGGGPPTHSGLTGRKNAIDTYGEYSRHSGSALSGKGPGRIDRIGAYAARYAAKNIVAANLADECEVQLSYTIGLSRPVSVQVETFGAGKVDDATLASLIETHFDFRPAAIIRQFNLRRLPALRKASFYQKLAAYGHVGRMDLNLPWEAVDKAESLLQRL